jgi:acetyl esterase/lipase
MGEGFMKAGAVLGVCAVVLAGAAVLGCGEDATGKGGGDGGGRAGTDVGDGWQYDTEGADPGSDGGDGLDGDPGDGEAADGGPADGGVHDGGPFDAGPSDAGRSDAGLSDAGLQDGGDLDIGSSDAESPDNGISDTGVPDAGLHDGGPTDSGPFDAGWRDGGLEAVQIVNNCNVPKPANPPDITVQLNVSFASGDGLQQKLDIAWPAGAGGQHPLVVLVHGGGWVSGSKTGLNTAMKTLAGVGYTAAAIDYRLANASCPHDAGTCQPNHFPAAVEDIRCAVRWLRANAAAYSIDPGRVAALGVSAGAHLAAMLGTAADVPGLDGACTVAGSPAVNAVLGYFGAYDLRPSAPLTADARALAVQFLGEAPQETGIGALASPITHIDANDPPFFLLHGTADTMSPVAQSRNMLAALRGAGVQATLWEEPGADHGYPAPFSAAYPTATCTALAFLEQRLKP